MNLARIAAGLFFLVGAGCVHPISEHFRQSVDETLTFSMLIGSPDVHRGKTVMLGGTIVQTRNLPEGSEVEVVQRELGSMGYPYGGDKSGGRFIFFHPTFLEPEVFAKGREITGVGRVTGSKTGKVGSADYRFPIVEAQQLHLWEPVERYPYYYPYYWEPFYNPYYYSPHRRFYRHHYPC